MQRLVAYDLIHLNYHISRSKIQPKIKKKINVGPAKNLKKKKKLSFHTAKNLFKINRHDMPATLSSLVLSTKNVGSDESS